MSDNFGQEGRFRSKLVSERSHSINRVISDKMFYFAFTNDMETAGRDPTIIHVATVDFYKCRRIDGDFLSLIGNQSSCASEFS